MHHPRPPARPLLRCAALAALALFLASACSSSDPKPDPSLTGAGRYALDGAAVLDACAKDLPDDTAIFFALDGAALMNAPRDLGLVPPSWDSSAFEKAVGDFTAQRLGVNIARADWIAVAVAPPGQDRDAFLALIAQGDFAKPATPAARTLGGQSIYAVREDDWALAHLDGSTRVALFLEGSEAHWAAVRSGDRAALAKSPNQALLKRVVAAMRSAPLLIAMQSSHPAMQEELDDLTDGHLPVPKAGAIGLDRAAIRLAVHDTPERLRAIVSTLTAARDKIKGELSQGVQRVASMSLPEAVMTTMAYHLIDPLFATLTPKQDGDMLALTLDNGVSGPAIAAAVLPLFMFSTMGAMMPPPDVIMPAVPPQPLEGDGSTM